MLKRQGYRPALHLANGTHQPRPALLASRDATLVLAVSPRSIHDLLLEACEMLQMDPPELYIRQNPVPNAYTLAISGRTPFIVIHTSLVELLTPKELQAVIAHELG